MKNLSNWLTTNKISLNITKKLKLLSSNLKWKNMKVLLNFNLIYRHRLYPSNNIKYLGIKIDKIWIMLTHHVNYVSTKLIRANAILFKITNYVNPKILKVPSILLFLNSLKFLFSCFGIKLWIYQMPYNPSR